MSFLLEILGRGLVSSLRAVLGEKLPDVTELGLAALRSRCTAAPADDEARVLLGLKYLETGEALRARGCFEEVLKHDDESLPGLLGLTCAHDEMGQTAAALECLNQARLVEILDPLILFCIGLCHEKLGHDQDAIDAFQAVLRVCPTMRNAHERLAAVFLKQGLYQQACEHYEQLVSLDPQRMSDRLSLANLYLKVGQPQAAAEHYEVAISLDPENWQSQDDQVTACEQAGLFEEAIQQLQDLIQQQPDFADHHFRLGDLYARRGDDRAALQAYEQALGIQPEYLEAMVKLGTTHLRMGEFIDAARSFNRAVELNDRLLSACVGLGVAQLHAGRREDGLASLQLASKIEPNSALLFSETARMQLKASAGEHARQQQAAAGSQERGDPPPAVAGLLDRQIERHRLAIRENPGHADLHYRLGLLLRNRRRLEDAIVALREAVGINPVYEKALVKLGLALQEAGRLDEAIACFEQALEIQPEQARLHYQLGLLFAEQHLFELAVQHFEQARRKALGDDAEIQAHLSLALQHAGVLDRAECSWRRTCELEAESDGPVS